MGADDPLQLSKTDPRAQTSPDSPFERGALVDRYVVLGCVGKGAMGVVYAAYDPKLDRRVALKVLRGEALAGPQDPRRARFLREAQVMARLSHANVVAVHDVGSFGGRDFIAMEFVEGRSLGEWLRTGPHPWRDVLRAFTAAGEGLRAAHEAGLVHRDFKPDNVLLSFRGAVRVSDFGIARWVDDGPQNPTPSGSALVTHAGALMGTPAYMSPEQWLTAPTDARSDQFSFCVALYQALYGQHPFPGASLLAVRDQVLRGVLPSAPRGPVPRRVRLALERGLALRPEDRHENMAALLEALGSDPALRTARSPLAVVAVAAVATALGLAATVGGLTRASERALYDLAQARLGPVTAPSHVAVIGLDDRTLASYPDTPLVLFGPLVARAVTHLREAGARVIAIDLIFELSTDRWLTPLAGDALGRDYDLPLREALNGGQVVLATALDPGGGQRPPAPELVLSLPGRARDLGLANLTPDDDGVLRRFDPAPVGELTPFPVLVAHRLGVDVTMTNRMRPIVFSGPPGTVPQGSLGDWVDGIPANGEALVRGRAVVLGALDSRTQDLFATPFSRVGARGSWMSGAELHANVIEQLAAGRSRRELSPPAGALYLLVVAALCALATLRLPVWSASLAVGAVAVAQVVAFVAAWQASLQLHLVDALATALGATLLALALRSWAEQRSRSATLRSTT